MKKITIFAVSLFLTIAYCQTLAQDTKYYASNAARKAKRIEVRTEHKEIKKITENNISNFNLKGFNDDFDTSSNVVWTKTDQYDIASFSKNDRETKAYYDFEGNLIGTTTLKHFTDLPARAQKIITKRYRGYTMDFSIVYNLDKLNDTQMILINDEFVNTDNYFVQLSKGTAKIVLQVTPVGKVVLFKKLK